MEIKKWLCNGALSFKGTVAGRHFVLGIVQLKATDRAIQGSNPGGSKIYFLSLFSDLCRPGLRLTESPVQWVPAVKRPERGLTTDVHCVPKLMNGRAFVSHPLRIMMAGTGATYIYIYKGIGKFHSRTDHERPEGE